MINTQICTYYLSFFCHQRRVKCDNDLITPNPTTKTHYPYQILLASIVYHHLNSFLKQIYFLSHIELFLEAALMFALMQSSLMPRLHCSSFVKNADIKISFCETVNSTPSEQKYCTTCLRMVVIFKSTNTNTCNQSKLYPI